MRRTVIFLVFCAITFFGCPSERSTRAAAASHIVYTETDTVFCTLTGGDILSLKGVTAEGDTVRFQNRSVLRIVYRKTGTDITDQYINRDLVQIELAKQKALAQRAQLRADVASGRRNARDLELQAPVELLFAKVNAPGTRAPSVSFVLLNLSDKTIDMFKVKVSCRDGRNRSLNGVGGRDNVFQASSGIPIEAGKDFSTSLRLPYHPGTARATVEVYYLEFEDHSWWRGDESLEAR